MIYHFNAQTLIVMEWKLSDYTDHLDTSQHAMSTVFYAPTITGEPLQITSVEKKKKNATYMQESL